jgi:hypothetical protein
VIFTARAGLTLRSQLLLGLDNVHNSDIHGVADAFHHNLSIEQGYFVLKRGEHAAYRGGQRTLFFLVEGAFLTLLAYFIIIPALRAGKKIIRSR